MAIRKPNLSVTEARRLADIRAAAREDMPESIMPETFPSAAPAAPAPPSPLPAAPAPPATVSDVAPAAVAPPTPPVASVRAVTTAPGPVVAAMTGPGPVVAATSAPSRKRAADEAPASPARPAFPSFRQDDPEKAQIYLSANYPRPGLSPTFELVCRHYPPQKALQMILRRALQDYDALLESGAFQTIASEYDIDDRASPASSIQTSRMMEKSLLATARAHFDPLGLESARAFGRKLATAALAAFFAHEPKRPL